MARDTYGQSFFGEITNRLSRLLNLEGQIPVKLQEGVMPVVVVGDGTLPGMSSFKGRRWMAQLQANGTGTCTIAATAGGEGIIVEGALIRTGTLAATVTFRYLNAAQVTAIVGTLISPTPARTLDAPADDVPPLQIYGGTGGTTIGQILNVSATSADMPLYIPGGFFLSPGCGFGINFSAGVPSGYFYGRVF